MPISLGIGVRVTQLGSTAAAFSPISIAPHLWLDPSDLSTLFQTDDTSTPVTADGQTVGRINDKSGSGFHLTQSTAGARPLYKTSGGLHWLEFDGVDEFMMVSSGALAQPWERVSAIRQLSWTDGDRIYAPVSGGSSFLYQQGSTPNLAMEDGSTFSNAVTAASIDADVVITERHNGASSRAAVDNGSYVTGNPGTTDANGFRLSDASSFGHFRFYGLVTVARLLTDPEIASLRTYLAAKQGRVL